VDSMKKGYIYSLNDPITDIPRYIGWSGQLEARYKRHCNTKEKTHKGHWIRKLKSEGLKPNLEIIDEVNIEECAFWEQHYISLYKSWNFKLVNSSFGGEGTIGYNMPSWVKDKIVKTKRENGTFEIASKKAAETWLKNPRRLLVLKEVAIKNKENGTYELARERMRTDKNPGKKQMKPVLQYDFDGTFIKEWESGAGAGKKLNISRERIGRNCRNILKTAGGFQWKYKTNEIIYNISPIVAKRSLRFKKL